NPDYDILQVQADAKVNEDAFNARLAHKLSQNWSIYCRFCQDAGENTQPEGVTGRVATSNATPRNAIVALQGILSQTMLNELKIGYNAANTVIAGSAPTVNGVDLSQITINLTGSVANTGIPGQGASSGVAVPGGLLRQTSAANGRG